MGGIDGDKDHFYWLFELSIRHPVFLCNYIGGREVFQIFGQHDLSTI